MIESSLPAVLRERASLQPNDLAFTFMDYDTDPEGVAKTLTWAQLYQQSVAVAHELRQHGEIGDRVVFMDKGVILDEGTPEEVIVKPRHKRIQDFLSRLN